MSPKKRSAVSMDENPTEVSAAPNEKRPREKKAKLPRKPRPTKIKHLRTINTVKVKLKLPKPTVTSPFGCPLAAALEERDIPDTAKHLPPAAYVKLANEVALSQLAKKPSSQPTTPDVKVKSPDLVTKSTSLLDSTKSPRLPVSPVNSVVMSPRLRFGSPSLVVTKLHTPPVKTAPVKKKSTPKPKIGDTDDIDDKMESDPSQPLNTDASPSLTKNKLPTTRRKKTAVKRIYKPKVICDTPVETDTDVEVTEPSSSVENPFACPLTAAVEEKKEFCDMANQLPLVDNLKLTNEVAQAQLAKKPSSQPTTPDVKVKSPDLINKTSSPLNSTKSPRLPVTPVNNVVRSPRLRFGSPSLVVSNLHTPPVKTAPVKKKITPKPKICDTDVIDDKVQTDPSLHLNTDASTSLTKNKLLTTRRKKTAVKRIYKAKVNCDNITWHTKPVETDTDVEVTEPSVENPFECPLTAALKEKEICEMANDLPPVDYVKLAIEDASPSLTKNKLATTRGKKTTVKGIYKPKAICDIPVKTDTDVEVTEPSASVENDSKSIVGSPSLVATAPVKIQAAKRIRKPRIIPESAVVTDTSEDIPLKKPARKYVKRPKKEKKTTEQFDQMEAPQVSETQEIDPVEILETASVALPPPAKKRRGRPKKNNTHTATNINTNISLATNKRNQKLRKQRITSTEGVPPKRKRRNPKNFILPSAENQIINLDLEAIKSPSKATENLQEIQETCTADMETLPKTLVKTVNTEQSIAPIEPSLIASRNTSVSDTFSWAREISSSSTATTPSRELCPKDVKIILAKIDSDTTSHSEKLSSINRTKTVIEGDLGNSNKRKRKPVRRQLQPKNRRVEETVESEPCSAAGNATTSTSDSLSSSEKSSLATAPSKSVTAFNKISLVLENMRQTKHSLDLEFNNWIGDENISADDVERLIEDFKVQVLKPEMDFIKKCQSRRNSKVPSVSNNESVINDCVSATGIENMPGIESPPVEPEPQFTDIKDVPECFDKNLFGDESFSDTVRRKTNEYSCYDDDDVLSIFATDSLAGDLTDIRRSVASPREFDELTNTDDHLKDDQRNDEPVQAQFEFTKPSEVPNSPVHKEIVFPDSTSKLTNRQEKISNTSQDVCKVKRKIVLSNTKKPLWMEDRYAVSTPTKCRMFKGVCFFNLISRCKQNKCTFLHQEPKWMHVQQTLNNVSDGDLISEYLVVRKYPQLRGRYTAAFVIECEKRGLTDCLLEMVIDSRTENEDLKTVVRETTLMHFNERNLNDYADLLKMSLDSEQLCDVLMRTMAVTTNFSRFKPVFIKLTSFMVQANKSFAVDVATMLLERILILPFEEALVSSLISILKNTDRSILKHSHISKLMNKLSENNHNELLNDLEQYKMEPIPQLVQMMPPKLVYDSVQYPAAKGQTHKRYTSPDTTHLEQNRPGQETPTLITRTLHNNSLAPSKGHPANFNVTPSPSSGNLVNFNAAPSPPANRRDWYTPNRMMCARGHGARMRGHRPMSGYWARGHRGGPRLGPNMYPRWQGHGYSYPPPPPPP